MRITLLCDHPSESYQAVLFVSCGIVYHVLMRFFFTFIVFDIKKKIRFTPEITALKPDWFLYFSYMNVLYY